MFNLGRKKEKHPFAPLGVDMHSHLLPGIDDGAADIEASLFLIQALRDMGYRKFITTPHIYAEIYPNDTHSLQRAFDRLAPAMEGGDLPSLHFAAEYFLDDHVGSLLKGNQPLLTVHDNWMLVETSFVQPPMDLDRRLFDLQVAGYKPVLAHPERYPYWHGGKQYHALKEKGVLLQINLLSLSGYYGKPVAEAARYLVRENLVDLVGTDCHHRRHIAALQKDADAIMKFLEPLIRKDRLLNAGL
jgi:tyrosine-protein phosphatase YwqE